MKDVINSTTLRVLQLFFVFADFLPSFPIGQPRAAAAAPPAATFVRRKLLFMSFYYKRPMGHGAMATKFRLGSVTQTESAVRSADTPQPPTSSSPENTNQSDKNSHLEPPSHFANSCNRCYRLKKKCSREFPRCSNCTRLGSDCEYEDKKAKRRKTEMNSSLVEIHVVEGANTRNSPTPQDPQNAPDGTRSVSVPSLLRAESPLGARRLSHRALIAKRSALRALIPPTPMNLREEYITMDSVPEDKAHTFANSFFVNYGTKYPFISQTRFFSWFGRINFDQEAIVNLDGYLVMAIGLLIHDSNTKLATFSTFFSEKIIESIVDIIDFDMSQSLDLENVRLLLLLGIYSLHMFHADLCWSIVGALDRIAIQLDLYKSAEILHQRLFWSIYNFDKELSILRNKPSQVPPRHFIALPFPLTGSLHGQPDHNLDVINQEICYYQLVDRLVSQKLAVSLKETLKALASDVEKWRVSTSKIIHTRYCDSPMLQHYVSQVNMKYYYLFVEMDQVSESHLSQFTLQFLLNSFTLLISENHKICGLSLHNLFWYQLLFRVVKCTLDSLPRLLQGSDAAAEFADFNNNLQLIVNIVKFLSRQNGPYAAKVDRFQQKLAEFAMLLIRSDAAGDTAALELARVEVENEVNQLL